MTYDQFTEALRATRGSGEWFLRDNNEIRLRVGEGREASGMVLCPITAVAFYLTGQAYGEDEDSGARAIELGRGGDGKLVDRVVSAADDHLTSYRGTRKDLLSATGLSPDGCEPCECEE